jgi:hypothetical protein
MLCISKADLLKNIDLDDLKQYMLYELNYKDTNLTHIDSNSKSDSNSNSKSDSNSKSNSNSNKLIETVNVPRNLIQIKYTKKYSKYNEPSKINNSKNFADKLFWIFYKILNNFSTSDLENINSFKTMKDFKISCVEKIRLQKNILKEFKIQRMLVEDDLTNNEKISFKTFHALCVLYLINVIVIRDNNTYCVLCTNNDENVINIKNYKLIQISNVILSETFNNFDVELVTYSEEQLQNMLKTYYNIENIEKPIKAFSSYSLSDLTNIAIKLNINVFDEHGKKKKKQDLYESILKKIT